LRLVRAAVALAILVSAVVPASAADRAAPLRVGMDTRQAPWSWVPGRDLTHEDFKKAPAPLTAADRKALVGIDVDVLTALEKRLGSPLQVVPASWFELEAGLASRRFDLILSSWTPNPRTPKDVVASASYYDWGLLIAVRADEKGIASFQDLDGRKVGHYRDPAVERSLLAMGRAAQLVSSDDPDALFRQMHAGALDAVIFDSPYVRWRVAHDPGLRAVGEPLNRLGYHIGTRRADETLRQRVDAALLAMRSAGELDAIRKRWESAAAPR
jgi:polar amino acid transport system substrate-binding protein